MGHLLIQVLLKYRTKEPSIFFYNQIHIRHDLPKTRRTSILPKPSFVFGNFFLCPEPGKNSSWGNSPFRENVRPVNSMSEPRFFISITLQETKMILDKRGKDLFSKIWLRTNKVKKFLWYKKVRSFIVVANRTLNMECLTKLTWDTLLRCNLIYPADCIRGNLWNVER